MFTLTFRVPFNFKKENETFGDSCDQEDDIGLSLTCLNQVGRPWPSYKATPFYR